MPLKFDSQPGINYTFPTGLDSYKWSMLDGSDAYANKKQAWITFRYPFGGRAVVFKAFVTQFSDTFSPSFEEDTVYGRTDSIKSYTGTKRSISLGFDVVASSDEEAIGNMEKVQKLAQFMYPTYENSSDASTISGPPIIRLGFMNMITSQGSSVAGKSVEISDSDNHPYEISYTNQFKSQDDYGTDGLPGVVTSVSYDFNLQTNTNNVTVGKGAIMSKVISVSIGFDPIHEHVIDGSTTSPNTNFPYGVNLEKLQGDLKTKLVVSTEDGSVDAFSDPTKREAYTKTAKDLFENSLSRLEQNFLFTANTDGGGTTLGKVLTGDDGKLIVDSSQNPDEVFDTFTNAVDAGKNRIAEQKKKQQNIDLANARYNSLFGKSRLKRDSKRDKRSDLVTSYFDETNEQNVRDINEQYRPENGE